MSRNPDDLKTMPLYRDVDRVYNELAALGLAGDDRLSAADLAIFDQYHYHGTDAVDAAITSLGIGANDRVLEIGSGIGGPARHIAAMSGARVIALELQPVPERHCKRPDAALWPVRQRRACLRGRARLFAGRH